MMAMRLSRLVGLALLAACAPPHNGPALNEQVIVDDREGTTAQYYGGYRVGGYLVDHFGRRNGVHYLVVSSAGAVALDHNSRDLAFDVGFVVAQETECSGSRMRLLRDGGKYHPASNQSGGLTEGYDAWVFKASCDEGK